MLTPQNTEWPGLTRVWDVPGTAWAAAARAVGQQVVLAMEVDYILSSSDGGPALACSRP